MFFFFFLFFHPVVRVRFISLWLHQRWVRSLWCECVLHILGTPMALNISELSVHFFGFNMKHLSCCWIFLQLDIHLHDRRKISGQLEYPSQCRGFRFQNENLARYFKIPIKIFDFTFSVMSLIWHMCKIVHFQLPLHLNSYTFKINHH